VTRVVPFAERLALPLIGAPMFIASYPELVLAQCRAGVLGTFPSLNARSVEALEAWKGIWSVGQRAGTIHDGPPVAELVARSLREYAAAPSVPRP